MTTPTESGFFRVQQEQDLATVLVLRPRITDEDNVDQFGQFLLDLIDTTGARRMLMDATNVEFVTSSVLGKLITVHRTLQREGGRLVLCSCSPALMDILETTRLTSLFEIAEDAAAGRAMLESA